eukprot:g7648.t1
MSDSELEEYCDSDADHRQEEVEYRITRRASRPKRIKKRSSSSDLFIARGSTRQHQITSTSSSSRRHSKGVKKCIALTKMRNAERLYKELNTTIHILNLTVKYEPEPFAKSLHDSDHETVNFTVNSDSGEGSLNHQCPDYQDSLVESPTFQDWPEDQENMLQTIEALHITEEKRGIDNHHHHQELPQSIQKTIDASDDAIHQLKHLNLSDAIMNKQCSFEFMKRVENALKNALQKMNEIIEELQDQNCSLQSSDMEVGSFSSMGSLMTEAHENCRKLGLACQDLFDISLDTCLNALILLELLFESCDNDLDSILTQCLPQTMDLIRLYQKLMDLESKMSIQGIGPVRLVKNERTEGRKLNTVQTLVHSVNKLVTEIQRHLLHEKYMESGTLSESMTLRTGNDDDVVVEASSPLIVLKQSWNWLCGVSLRLGKLHKGLRMEIFSLHLTTLLDATHRCIEIQSTPEITEIINSATSLEKYEIQPLSEDEVKCQEWLLPSICKLQSHVKNVIRQINRDSTLQTVDLSHLVTLRRRFTQLILVTITRMSRSTLCHENLTQMRMEMRRSQAMETTKLIQKFLESPLVDQESEMDDFDAINKIMNDLITSICTLNSKLQLHKNKSVTLSEQPISVSVVESTTSRTPLDRLISEELESSSSVEYKSPFQTQTASSLEASVIMFQQQGSSLSLPGVVPDMGSLELNSLDQPLRPIPSLGHFLEVDCKDLEILNPLGSGSSANVYLMNYFSSQVAVKVAKEPEVNSRAELRIQKEAEIHQRVNNHPQIVRYFGKYMDTSQSPARTLGIIMEYCKLGNLTSAIREAQWLKDLENDGQDISSKKPYLGYHLYKDWPRRLTLGCQVAAGMSYLHHKQIVHRDLTSYNVVLYPTGSDEQFGAKICDFERSNYIPEGETIPRTSAFANSPPWSAPEVLKNEEYTTQADVFSMGVILWELMYLDNPWNKLKELMCQNEVVISCHLSNGSRLPLSPEDAPEGIPEFNDLVELVKSTWKDDPQERPSMGSFHRSLDSIRRTMEERIQQ